jgi:hypothetical protein
MQDLALHIARKKAASEGEIIAIKQSKEDIKNSRGFAKMAHDKQIYGSKRT